MRAFFAVVVFFTGLMPWGLQAPAAEPGSSDSDFGPAGGGLVMVVREDQNESWTDVIQDDEGRLVVAGGYDVEDPPGSGFWGRVVEVRRYLDNGTLDPDFGTSAENGIVEVGRDAVTSQPIRLALDEIGRIIVGATFVSSGSDTDIKVIRLTSGGVPDWTFNSGLWATVTFGSSTDDILAGVAVQSDYKILIAGTWQYNGDDHDFAAVRLNLDGTLDSGYGSGGVASVAFDLVPGGHDEAAAAVIDGLDRLVIAGTADGDGSTEFAVARFTTAGVLDTSFSGDGKATFANHQGSFYPVYPYNYCNDVAVDANNGLVLSGSSFAVFEADPTSDVALLRLSEDGSPISLFGGQNNGFALIDLNLSQPGGTSSDDYGHGVAFAPDGKIVVVGEASDVNSSGYDSFVARVTELGVPDDGFGVAGGGWTVVIFVSGAVSYFREVAIQSDDKIVAVGGCQNGVNLDDEMAMARFFGGPLFADGFESGGTTQWSLAVGQ